MANWAKIIKGMGENMQFDDCMKQPMQALSYLCEAADAGLVSYTETDGKVGITGQIPDCSQHGTAFAADGMRCILLGLGAKYPNHCVTLVTHDLNSFTIPGLGDLITEIRLNN